MRIGICGPAYTLQSPNACAEELINMYLERNENPLTQQKSPFHLLPTPGLSLFATVSGGAGGRQIAAVDVGGTKRLFAVVNRRFVEIAANGTVTERGTVADDGLPAHIAASSTEVLITAGGTAYYFLPASNTFAAVSDLAGVTCSHAAWCDGFFMVLLADRFRISAAGDVTSWDALEYATPSYIAGGLKALLVEHHDPWVWSEDRAVVYYNSGASFPFDPRQETVEVGIVAPSSAVMVDNAPLWLGSNKDGQGMAWRGSGAAAQRISNHAVEYAWSRYSTLADAVGFAYQEQGHSFWVISFPAADATWVYDASLPPEIGWHKRAYWSQGAWSRHLAQAHAFCFGKHLVCDYNSGKIFEMKVPQASGGAWTFADDAGQPIRRLRRGPTVHGEGKRLFVGRMEVFLESGLGPIPPLEDGGGNARDPQVMLRFSKDNGHTWSNERVLNAGQAGNYAARVIARRLGRAYQFTPEISMSDPIGWRIVGDNLELTSGY